MYVSFNTLQDKKRCSFKNKSQLISEHQQVIKCRDWLYGRLKYSSSKIVRGRQLEPPTPALTIRTKKSKGSEWLLPWWWHCRILQVSVYLGPDNGGHPVEQEWGIQAHKDVQPAQQVAHQLPLLPFSLPVVLAKETHSPLSRAMNWQRYQTKE